MAGNVVNLGGGNRIEFDWRAFDQVRKSPEMQALVRETANGIASRAGENFDVRERTHPSRVTATVAARNDAGMIEESTGKVLSRAVI